MPVSDIAAPDSPPRLRQADIFIHSYAIDSPIFAVSPLMPPLRRYFHAIAMPPADSLSHYAD